MTNPAAGDVYDDEDDVREIGPYSSAAEHLRDLLRALQLALRGAAADKRDGDAAADVERPRSEARRAVLERRITARAACSPLTNVPLERLRRVFGLSATEVSTLVLLTGMELDVRLRARAIAVMDDVLRRQPDVGLLQAALYCDAAERVPEELGADGRLERFGLIQIDSLTSMPFTLRRVRVTERVLALLHGRDVLSGEVARVARLLPARRASELVLAGPTFDEVSGLLAAAVDAGRDGARHPLVLLSGAEGAGRKALVAAAAAHLGLRVLAINAPMLPRAEPELRALGTALVRDAMLLGAVPLLEDVERHPSADGLDDVLLAGYLGPVAATAGKLLGKPPIFARGHVVIEVRTPDEAERECLWRRAGASESLARWAAERYVITPGVLERAATAALTKASARDGAGAARLDAADLHDGVRSVLDAKLATLGTRITWRQTWDDLVLPDDATLEIREFIARVRHRRQVFEHWGFGRKVAKGLGLSALFAGPPGTGKTMVAGIIAGELGLDLYQIDLSKVVSKWVGETEKNLGELFDAAEAGHAILLFDEADSLFAKRTAVQSSNDRYANLEVNYLLQRMESFAGIVILTTNHDTAIDEAFRRRLSLRIEFPVPDVDERAHLWRALLPAEAEVARDVDFRALAERFEMTGGYIKNAIVRAAFLAVDEGAPISMRHLARAARSEYQAMGKVIAHL